ncbi:hypothetical protein BAQU_0026 [Bifidobacterium aquikefiri]|uniref:Uncharacterized protein n=1 Tax=Bifidobacterium aquikefiri TaxID=1653207 RepID=A0A261GBB8_9BIFI|nr:hypothetical protein BAQU_0026 [Bifidobacterium aquikefiri]
MLFVHISYAQLSTFTHLSGVPYDKVIMSSMMMKLEYVVGFIWQLIGSLFGDIFSGYDSDVAYSTI